MEKRKAGCAPVLISGADPYAVFETERYWAGDIGYRKDATGQGYRDFLESNLPRVEYIVSKRPGRVLDVGCGMGFLVAHLRRWAIDAWGIDVSQYAIDRAPEEVKPYLAVGSAAKLPFPDRHFDMCVQFGVLEHLTPEDARAACKEIVRVSRRGIMAPGLSTELSMQLPKEQQDQTHRTILDYYGWEALFPPDYECEFWEGADETWRLANQFKVLVVAPVAYPVGGAGYGGIERLAFLLSRELARRGINVTLAGAQRSRAPWGVKLVETIPPNPDLVGGEALAFSILRPEVEGYNVVLDLSHSHLAGRLLPYHTRQVSVIWHSPPMMQPPQPQWNVTALSAWQAREHFYHTGQKARVLDVHILDAYRPEGTPGDRFLAVGRLTPLKGMLEAAQLCQEMRVGLDIVGPLGEDLAYNQQVLALCRDGVEYLGELPHRAVLEMAARARARIYPVGHEEAHSHALVDSLSVGCPAVVYDRGALSEVVEHGVDGFVARSKEDFVEFMLEAHELDRTEIRRRAWERWGPQAVGDRLLSVLVEAARGARW